MRSPIALLSAALLGLLVPLGIGLAVAQADGRATRSNIIPVDQIKRGMKGYGLTVFEGTKPERFEVEVIDVLKNFRPRQELILVKTSHPRLEVAKVVAGMSGSPIFLDGKMAGAYAYGWTFGREPVAGVTPIRSMLDDLDRPLPELIDGWRLKPGPKKETHAEQDAPRASRGAIQRHRFLGPLLDYDLRGHSTQIASTNRVTAPSSNTPLRQVSTPVLIGGMTGGAVELATQLLSPLGLEPLQAGGGGGVEPDAPSRYVDGSAVGVELIRGDMSAMGLGTVTRVEGDRLVAFGHPMMNAGVTALPAALGRVLWFLASDFRSFKIGMPVRPLGALVNDRQASIVVSHSARAPVMPVKMQIDGAAGAPYTAWEFEVAHEKFLTPTFMAVALGNALQATAAEHQDVSWNATSKLRIGGHGEIQLKDFGVASGGTPDPREFVTSNLVRAVGGLLNNPWEPVLIEGAEMKIHLRYGREILRLRGAEVLEQEVEAGQTARIRLTLVPYAGPPVTRVLPLPIPKHLAGETLKVVIQPGYKVRRERAEPENLSDLVSTLENQTYPPKSVVLSYASGSGVSFKGNVAMNLPPGALDSIRPTSASLAPESFRAETRHVFTVPEFVSGTDKVTIRIKPVLR